jgi:hypothetical protein
MHNAMKSFPTAFLLSFLAVSTMLSFAAELAVPAVAETNRPNSFYPGNRAPLVPSAFIKLPIGSIKPSGWVQEQLLMMANGFVGRLPEISKWCKFEGSAWTSHNGEGEFGWEELPYWLKGFTDLGYVLNDQRIIGESRRWIDAIIDAQRADGYFGSKTNAITFDIWPNMVVLQALRSHYEATHDPRVPAFMTRYCKWLTSIPRDKYLPESWQHWRGGDNLESIYWLYNLTGEDWLLPLAKFNHERTADWTTGIPTWHGVNLTQGFREPAEYYQQAHDRRFLNATLRNYDTVMKKYGQVPGGMFGADENAREGYYGPRQGAETCSMVEFMYSDEMLLGITGDAVWADRCEEIAFNSLPASMTPDLKGLHYLTAPNQIQLDRTNKAPMIENDGDMFSYNPHSYRCCQHNVAFGWPYYAEHLWMATPNNGLAAVLYAASGVTAKVGDGTEVKITEKTDYPFEESVEFSVGPVKAVSFPLTLRIPNWCNRPTVTVNGKPFDTMQTTGPKGAWVTINRTWGTNDKVRLEIPMEISVRVWETNQNSVSIDRGPLTYSLLIGERWQAYGNYDPWPAFEVFPASPWNYALIIDKANPNASFQVSQKDGKLARQPWTSDSVPIKLKGKGRRLPQWQQETNGMAGLLQMSPVRATTPVEEITLIPMGAARLRISAFPHVGEGPSAHDWK